MSNHVQCPLSLRRPGTLPPAGLAMFVWILLMLLGPANARESPQVHDADVEDGFSVVMSNETTARPESDASTTVSLPEFSRRDALIGGLTVFVLAVFLGFEVIAKVPPTLHTPLMSGSNAISGVTVVGALLVAGESVGTVTLLGGLAVVLATINVVGGFMVTGRMLAMFRIR